MWIGGGGDGGLHERTPYWLNGIVPLAFLLRNANVSLSPVAGLYKAPRNSEVALNASRTAEAKVDCGHALSSRKLVEDERQFWVPHGDHAHPVMEHLMSVDILAQVECYIEYILDHQAADGWLGPDAGTDAGAPWGRAYLILSLAMYAEATPEAFDRVSSAILQYSLKLRDVITKLPLQSWAQQRWFEMALGVQWLLDHDAAAGHDAELIDLMQLLHTQGSDWEIWFDAGTFPAEAGPKGANNHNVNNAQALKSAAILYRFTKNASLETLSRTRVEKLDAHCGLPTVTSSSTARTRLRAASSCAASSRPCTRTQSCSAPLARRPRSTAPSASRTTRCQRRGPRPRVATCGRTSICRR